MEFVCLSVCHVVLLALYFFFGLLNMTVSSYTTFVHKVLRLSLLKKKKIGAGVSNASFRLAEVERTNANSTCAVFRTAFPGIAQQLRKPRY
jgi:hypothetical protein